MRLFNAIVNINQWFNYGKTWLLLPLTLLVISSQISILLIFFGQEGNIILLFSLTITTIFISLILGVILFFKRAQQVDITMSGWRNPVPQLGYTAIWYIITELAIKNDLKVPTMFKNYGVDEWKDLHIVWEYVLKKGVDAKAQNICKEFFDKKKV